MTTTDARKRNTETKDETMTSHRAEAERALSSIDASDDPRNLPAGLDGIGNALLAIHDTLTEIRDRLPERECEDCDPPFWVEERTCRAHARPTFHDLEDVAAEFGVDLSADDPAPADVDPDEGLAKAHERAERAERACRTLGKVVEDQCRDALNATGLHHLIGEDGDGDWMAVWENLAELRPRAEKLEADLARRGELLAWAQKDRDAAQAELAQVQARCKALRADLPAQVCESLDFPPTSLLGEAVTAAVSDVLARDDERAAKGEQR